MDFDRETPKPRPAAERVKDWSEIYEEATWDESRLRNQAAR